MKRTLVYKSLIFTLLATVSCSTVSVLPESSYRLKKNIIHIKDNDKVKASDLEPYLRQKSNTYYFLGWNPFIYIYNWSKKGSEGWRDFTKSIGQAPVEYDSTAVYSTRLNFINHLKSLGYYDCNVKDSVVKRGRKASVIYSVETGSAYKLTNIKYDIEDKDIAKYILEDSSNSYIKEGEALSETILVNESDRISELLKRKGYYSFSNNYISFVADTSLGNRTASIVMIVRNYSRNEDPKERKNHRVYYINKVSILPDYDPTESVAGGAIIRDSVMTEKGVQINFRSKLRVRRYFLDRLNQINPGERYDLSLVNSTYNRFNNVNLFTGTNIRFDEVESADSTKGLVDCQIRLTPSKRQGYTLNLELSSNSNSLFGISPAVSYFHKNLFRGGEWLNLGFMGNFQMNLNNMVKSTELGVSASLSIPDFLFLPDIYLSGMANTLPRTDMKMLYNYQDRPEFTRTLVSAAYGYSWRRGKTTSYNLYPLQLSIVRLKNISSTFYQSLENPFIRNSYRNYFDLGAGFSINYISNPDPDTRESVVKIRWNNDIAGNVISIFDSSFKRDSTGARLIGNTPYSQYLKSDFTISYTTWITEKSALAFRFNGGIGYAYGNSRSMPFEKLFYAGGANSLRGWQARSVGPGYSQIDTTFSIPNQTGDIKLEVNAEYRFPIINKFEGALFLDAGNVWTVKRENTAVSGNFSFGSFYRNIAFNWGTGLRYNLKFVILRVDLGMVLYDPSIKSWIAPSKWLKKDTYAIQFGVGYPF